MKIVRPSENICHINPPDEAVETELPTPPTSSGTATPIPTETPLFIPTLTPTAP